MTQIVIVGPAPIGATYDEVALHARALTAEEVGTLYAARTIDERADIQALGWEEVYGATWPWAAGEVPVFANGLCRVRYNAARVAWAYDLYAGNTYLEYGRFTLWLQGSSWQRLVAVTGATLAEWTPERAVAHYVCETADPGEVYRADVYCTLQRGWGGPQWEVYPAADSGGVLPGAAVRYSPYFSGVTAEDWAVLWHGGLNPGVRDTDTDTWLNFGLVGTYAAPAEPWVAFCGGGRPVVASALRRAETVYTYRDGTAYGAERRAFAQAAPRLSSAAGYIGVRYNQAPGTAAEAEDYVLGGTTSKVDDWAAGNGVAVEEGQVTAVAPTVTLPAVRAQLPVGVYGVWAKVAAVDGGAEVTAQVQFGAGAAGTPVAYVGTTYTWVYCGEAVKTSAADDLYVYVWRSGGTGLVRIDRVFAVALERRLTVDPAYDGARDHGQANLYDARQVGTLVVRA